MTGVDVSFWLHVSPMLAAVAGLLVWKRERFARFFGLNDECSDNERDWAFAIVMVPVLMLVALLAWNVFGRGLQAGEALDRGPTTSRAMAVSDADVVELIPPMTATSAVTTTMAPPASIAPAVADGATWDRLADCESGDWDKDSQPIAGTARWDDQRGGYEGGVHFLNTTWLQAGGGRYAQHAYAATREQQIDVAASWLAKTSWAQWPKCSQKIGVR